MSYFDLHNPVTQGFLLGIVFTCLILIPGFLWMASRVLKRMMNGTW